jgi:hypothetical protein
VVTAAERAVAGTAAETVAATPQPTDRIAALVQGQGTSMVPWLWVESFATLDRLLRQP